MHFFINPSVFNREVKKKPVLIGHLFSTRMFSFLRMADEFNLMPFDPWPQKCVVMKITSHSEKSSECKILHCTDQ